jgi:hypothetical protein
MEVKQQKAPYNLINSTSMKHIRADDRITSQAATVMKASTYTSSDSESSSSDEGTDPPQYSTAGLFMCKPTDKPLPLAPQRSIPLPRFWKLSSSHHSSKLTEVAPDILRRTGSTTSTYSNESLGSRHTLSNKGVTDDAHLCLGKSAARSEGRSGDTSVQDAREKASFTPNKLRASRSLPLDDPIVESDDLQYSIYSSGNHTVMQFLKQRFGTCLVHRNDVCPSCIHKTNENDSRPATQACLCPIVFLS